MHASAVGGREVSRIEGFSDAVFGFALTLLVASHRGAAGLRALKQTLRGFLPFALTFALISWIWYLHYAFFRQFGLEDRLTIVLNSVLLFVVLFFVYPLKVMANALVGLWARQRVQQPERVRQPLPDGVVQRRRDRACSWCSSC